MVRLLTQASHIREGSPLAVHRPKTAPIAYQETLIAGRARALRTGHLSMVHRPTRRAYEPGLGFWALGSGKSLRNCSWKKQFFVPTLRVQDLGKIEEVRGQMWEVRRA